MVSAHEQKIRQELRAIELEILNTDNQTAQAQLEESYAKLLAQTTDRRSINIKKSLSRPRQQQLQHLRTQRRIEVVQKTQNIKELQQKWTHYDNEAFRNREPSNQTGSNAETYKQEYQEALIALLQRNGKLWTLTELAPLNHELTKVLKEIIIQWIQQEESIGVLVHIYNLQPWNERHSLKEEFDNAIKQRYQELVPEFLSATDISTMNSFDLIFHPELDTEQQIPKAIQKHIDDRLQGTAKDLIEDLEQSSRGMQQEFIKYLQKRFQATTPWPESLKSLTTTP